MNVIKPYRFMSKQEIEQVALNKLNRVQANRKRSLKGNCVAEAVADYLDIGIIWQIIAFDNEGYIAAMILPIQRKIIINAQIPALEGGFGKSTIAHEIGHWLLHIEHDALDVFKERMSPELIMTVEPFLCRSVTAQKGIEWQAQYFAGCFLMPKFKLQEVLRGRCLTNWKHLYAMKDEFGVTISNLTNRLQGLDWIHIPKGSKQIYRGHASPK